MGGKVLEYEAKDILNRGRQEGIQDIISRIKESGLMTPDLAKCFDIEIEKTEQNHEQKKQNICKI